LIVDLNSGQPRGKVKVSEEPERVGVNPQNGEVYVTCEEKGEVFVIDPDQQRVVAKIETGGRPRSIAFLPDSSRPYVACQNSGDGAAFDGGGPKILLKKQIPKKSPPLGTTDSRHGKKHYPFNSAGKNKWALRN